jgi:hypothetical protein
VDAETGHFCSAAFLLKILEKDREDFTFFSNGAKYMLEFDKQNIRAILRV